MDDFEQSILRMHCILFLAAASKFVFLQKKNYTRCFWDIFMKTFTQLYFTQTQQREVPINLCYWIFFQNDVHDNILTWYHKTTVSRIQILQDSKNFWNWFIFQMKPCLLNSAQVSRSVRGITKSIFIVATSFWNCNRCYSSFF